MDANKEESERCIQLGLMCLKEGHREKALKFFLKADRLHSSTKSKDLIKKLGKAKEKGPTAAEDYGAFGHYETSSDVRNRFQQTKDSENRKDNNNQDNFQDKNQDEPKNRERSRSRMRSAKTGGGGGVNASTTPNLGAHRATSAPQLGVDYSEEQHQDVQRIRSCKDYYEILNVNKDFGDDELKKQYRKMALKLHPDKNRAPGAIEAFKAVGNAYAVLSDSTKRERYDMYGGNDTPDLNSMRRRRSRDSSFFYEYDYHRGFESDMSADEIFNMFFGARFSTGERRRSNDHRNENSSLILQLAPLLFLVLLSVCSQFLISDPVFSLQKTPKYTEEKVTRDLRVVYYVKPDFQKHYHANLHRIEKLVEEDFVNRLRGDCFSERSQKEAMMWRARTFHDASLYEKANTLRTPSCDRLSELYA